MYVVTAPPVTPSVSDALTCCSPVVSAPLTEEQAAQISPLLKALADPVRLRLLSLIASRPGQEACACDLQDAFDLSQPTISHHLKVMHEAGLLTREKRGVWVHYAVDAATLGAVCTLFGGAC